MNGFQIGLLVLTVFPSVLALVPGVIIGLRRSRRR